MPFKFVFELYALIKIKKNFGFGRALMPSCLGWQHFSVFGCSPYCAQMARLVPGLMKARLPKNEMCCDWLAVPVRCDWLHRHNKYLDASLAARPHVNGAAILVRATLHNSHIGTEENIPDSSAVWGSTDRHTSIKTYLGVLSFTGKTEQLFLDVFWSFLALC